jgi:2C-methyl-D-erythritol 2,4-cyclodiphosphate synthase
MSASLAAVAKRKNEGPQNKPPYTPLYRGGVTGGDLCSAEQVKTEKQGVSEILAAADTLTPAQRKDLIARLSLAQNQEKGETRDKDMWALAVHEALLAAVGRGDRGGIAPMLVKRAVGVASAWTPVADFLAHSKLDTLKVVERQAVLRLLASLLVKRTKEIAAHVHAPLSPKLAAGQAQHIAALFEDEFPGYLAAGLALVVAKRLTVGYTPISEEDS